jgi:uncharacterized membrane protein
MKFGIRKMQKRPNIKLTLSPFEKRLDVASKIFLITIWFFTFYAFLKLPATIPTHFNASGQVDKYGDKSTLLFLSFLVTIIYFGLSQLNKYPHIFNYPQKITEDNAERQYAIATKMLRLLKLAILIIFFLIFLFTYLTTIGIINGLGIWFLPLTLVLLLVPTIGSIIQSLKK